jgi:hypothetical protein
MQTMGISWKGKGYVMGIYVNIYIYIQCGPPSYKSSWFINPINYSYVRIIHHKFWSYKRTNFAIVWGPHIVYIYNYIYIH